MSDVFDDTELRRRLGLNTSNAGKPPPKRWVRLVRREDDSYEFADLGPAELPDELAPWVSQLNRDGHDKETIGLAVSYYMRYRETGEYPSL